MTQNNHTVLVLGKDLLFILVGIFLIVKGRFLGAIVGFLALVWYGRDFWYRWKALFHSAAPKRDTVERPVGQNRPENAPVEDDGKIQVTDLSGAKEVEFEKE